MFYQTFILEEDEITKRTVFIFILNSETYEKIIHVAIGLTGIIIILRKQTKQNYESTFHLWPKKNS